MIITNFELCLETPGYRDESSVAEQLRMIADDLESGYYSGVVGATRNSWSVTAEDGEDEEED